MATAVSESTNESVKEISKLANEYGTDFVNLFYKSLDTKRHVNIIYIILVISATNMHLIFMKS